MAVRTFFAAALAAALTAASPALAGALRVSPVGLDLPAGRATATVTLRNDDDVQMNVQVRVFRWTQGPEGDTLTPTDEVAISPPIAPLAAKSERVVRVVRTAPDAPTEASYRVIVDELPAPPGTEGRQVRLLMRHSIPVFFTPAEGRSPKVAWTATLAGGAATVAGVNTGGRRLRIANLKLLDARGRVVAQRSGLVGYVLAGATVAWSVPMEPGVDGAAVRLTAETDAGPLDTPLGSRL